MFFLYSPLQHVVALSVDLTAGLWGASGAPALPCLSRGSLYLQEAVQ